MLLIALAGGKIQDRELIAQRLFEESGHQFVVWTVSSRNLLISRVNTLARSLKDLRNGRQDIPGLIYTHLLMEDEAVEFRKQGGVVWHLGSPTSIVVVIREGDLLVTPVRGGHRHFLDPLEALSELLLSRLTKPQVA